jgi:hypothetical protein
VRTETLFSFLVWLLRTSLRRGICIAFACSGLSVDSRKLDRHKRYGRDPVDRRRLRTRDSKLPFQQRSVVSTTHY